MKKFLEVHCKCQKYDKTTILQCAVFCHSIEETWSSWQDFYNQYHIVENWMSDAEQSLASISHEVRQPGEDMQIQVIVCYTFIDHAVRLLKLESLVKMRNCRL